MSDLRVALTALRARLDAAGVPFVVGGAFALAAHGYPRFTDDLDIMVLTRSLEPIHRAVQEDPRYEYINEVTFRDTPTGLFIDLFQVEDEAQRRAFDAAGSTTVYGAEDVKVLSADGLALMLLREASQGDPGKRSLRLRDIELLASGEGLDWESLRVWAKKMGYGEAYQDLRVEGKLPLQS